MASKEEISFQEALDAIHNGEKSRARDLLTRLIKSNSSNPQYWLYMSAVVGTPRELVFCLKETLKRDPKNFTARRGLMLQGELPAEPDLAVPLNLQRRNWESQFFNSQPIPGLTNRPSRLRFGLIAGALVILIVVIVAISSADHPGEVPNFIAWMQRYTPAPTSSTPIVNTSEPTITPTPVFAGTPGFVLISATPEPLYINTPHARTESYRSGINSFQKSDWTSAVTFLLQAVKEDPKADIYYLLGESYRNLKKNKEAAQAFDQALQIDPRFAPSYLGRARMRVFATPDQTEGIRTDLERAISLDQNFSEAVYELIMTKLNQDEAASALLDLETIILGQPDSPQIYRMRARANLILKQTDQAVADARKANQLDPGSLEGYRLLAETLRANDDLAGAVAPLEIYTRYILDDAEAIAWLGQAYAAQGNNAGALRLLDQAVSLDPQSFEVRITRAAVLIDMKEAKKAMEELRAADAIRLDALPVYLGLGRVSLLNEDYSEAWRNFTSALYLAQTDSERAQTYFWRATALELGKQIPQALNDWNELLRLPSQDVALGLRETARLHIQVLATATITPRLPTATASLTPTRTPSATTSLTPSRTSTATASPTSSRTPTTTLTPSSTPTSTPTLLSTATPAP